MKVFASCSLEAGPRALVVGLGVDGHTAQPDHVARQHGREGLEVDFQREENV